MVDRTVTLSVQAETRAEWDVRDGGHRDGLNSGRERKYGIDEIQANGRYVV